MSFGSNFSNGFFNQCVEFFVRHAAYFHRPGKRHGSLKDRGCFSLDFRRDQLMNEGVDILPAPRE